MKRYLYLLALLLPVVASAQKISQLTELTTPDSSTYIETSRSGVSNKMAWPNLFKSPVLITPNLGVATATSIAAGTLTGLGSGITIDASGFNGNLATTDDTLQEIAQKIDDLLFSGTFGETSLSTLANNQIMWSGLSPTRTLTFNVSGTDSVLTISSGVLDITTGAFRVGGADVLVSGGPLGTPSGGTVTNLTGTASININGTVGATTPAAGAFTTLSSTTPLPITSGGSGRATGTTAYSLIATGTTATGAEQTLANGATTEILVGGGASALPVWTTATGSGAPVRATSPTLVTPALGVATATSINGLTITSSTGTLTIPNGITLNAGAGGTLGTAAFTAATAYQASNATLAAIAANSGPVDISGTTLTIGPLGTPLAVTSGGSGRATNTTAYGLLAAGTTATGATQTLSAGATTDILVGGGASALPAWTTATGTGAPVRAGSPTLTGNPLAPTATTGDNDTSVATTAFVQDALKIVTKTTATSYTIGTTDSRELYGGVIYVTGAATLTIPAVAAGASFTVITKGAVAVSVDPNNADLIIRDGTTQADGEKVTNTSTTGDIAVFTYYDATGWYCSSNGWTNGG